MISKMAMEDIEALRADGIDVPPREVVRLNALGLKVERSAHGDGFSVLPRVAWLGELCFREPTIGDEMWLGMASRTFNADDGETMLLLRAVSLSGKPEDLPPATDKKAVLKAIEDFQRGPAKSYTASQLFAALSYAISGASPEHGESAPPRVAENGPEDGAEDTDSAEMDVPPLVAGVIMDGLALKLGTIDELAKLRPSQLRALTIYALAAKNGEGVYKGEHGRALGAYYRALDALKAQKQPDGGEVGNG